MKPSLHRTSWIALVTCLAALAADRLAAEVIASDSASDPAYADGWQGLNGFVPAETGSDNGGFGFLPWDFEEDDAFWDPDRSPYPTAHFIDTGPNSFNALGAPAFALTNANTPLFGYTTIATRPFAQPLRPGDEVSVDIDNPEMQKLVPMDSVGFLVALRTAGNTERFGLYTTQDFNGDEWTITDSAGEERTTGLSDTEGSGGFRFAVRLTGAESYRLTITPRGGAPMTFEGTLRRPDAGAITRIQFLMFGNGSGDGAREFYINDLRIESDQAPGPLQRPSDCNQDGGVDISDAICLLSRLFQGGELPCGPFATDPGNVGLLDGNGDSQVDLSDAVRLLDFLFRGSAPPVLGLSCVPIEGCPDNTAACQ
jgi:hypothetical protein